MANILQWVNLTRDNKFVGDGATSVGRLGPVRVKVKFAKATPVTFNVRVVTVSAPSTYTPTELARNKNFKIRHSRTHTTMSKPEIRIQDDVSLPAVGGNTYKVEAKHNGVVKETKVVETRRKIYYQPVAMAGITVPAMGPTQDYYKTLFLLLKEQGGNGSIPFKENVNVDDWATGRLPLIQAVKAAYTIDNFAPWAFTVAFVNMIGGQAEREYLPTVAAGAASFNLRPRIFRWGTDTLTFTLPGGDYLWWGMDPTDDAANGGRGIWLVTNSCVFVEDNGVTHDIPDINVTIDTTQKRTALGGYNTLKIVIPKQARNFWSGKTGRIWIKLLVVDGFAGGYSEPNINIITVAKRAWWRDNSDPKRLQVLNHEMGHKYGMVPEGQGISLDAGADLYGSTNVNDAAGNKIDQKGHQGPHCGKGVTYTPADPNPWEGTPACVMFGATSCYNAAAGTHLATTTTFCAACEKQVKKLDLDGRGLSGFINSVTSY